MTDSEVLRDMGRPHIISCAKANKRHSRFITTCEIRRSLSDLQLRPPSQKKFLRKLLMRAAASRPANKFPVVNPAVGHHATVP
jgi:hypothetical protein